jgi:hypothetical protein
MKTKYTKMIICCLLATFVIIGATEAQTSTDSSLSSRVDGDSVITSTPLPASQPEGSSETFRHEITIYGAEGVSSLNYSLDKEGGNSGENSIISGMLGVGYTWNINEYIAVVTGLEISKYGALTIYENISDERIYGTDRNRFNFKYSISKYEEKQVLMLLSIPVLAQYYIPLSGSVKFYMTGGFKLGLPVRSRATISPNTFATSGYYYFENQTYTDLPQHGFVSGQQLNSTVTDIDMNISLAASVETGARFFLYSNILLYIGAYFDGGLNNLRTITDQLLINYQTLNPSVFRYESILHTNHVNKVKIFGIGLKMKISFGL